MKHILLKQMFILILRPPSIKKCSQTIYQTLLGCMRLWDKTREIIWKERADKVCKILLEIQRPDGGFDIGYDFNFGRLHKKGESTSPELVGLMALVEYYKRFGDENVVTAAKRAANWIKANAIRMPANSWAIPYAPYSIKEVMVYNGTSFAAGALGVYLSVFPDSELETIYHGMNKYLFDVFSSFPEQPGKFWYYSDQSRNDLTELQREKIDYYHQMQQVEMHAEAELCLQSKYQVDIIGMASKHVAYKQKAIGLIPYANRREYFGEDIHLWGYCSCASGFLMAGKICKSRTTEYRKRAEMVYDWMYSHAWNGKYFYRAVSPNNIAIDTKFYVRSDAWVFNSFALAVKEDINSAKYLDVCEKCYLSMEKCNFSGIENHASNTRIRFISRVLTSIITLKKKYL